MGTAIPDPTSILREKIAEGNFPWREGYFPLREGNTLSLKKTKNNCTGDCSTNDTGFVV